MRVYKFYSAKWGREALRKKRLKLTTLEDINDPFEFIPFNLKEKSFRKPLIDIKEKLLKDKGIICFSRAWNNPVLWSHYADKHRGLALGFDVPDDLLLAANYVQELYDPERFLSELRGSMASGNNANLMQLLRSVLATKFDHWRYEDEFRLFVDIDSKESAGPIHFQEFDSDLVLQEVVLGANYEQCADSLNALDLGQNIMLTTARIAFTKFEVTKQNLKSKQKSL